MPDKPRGPGTRRDAAARLELRRRLAALYEEPDRIRAFLEDADVPTDRIDFAGGTLDVWRRALHEVERHERLWPVLRGASAEYPARFSVDELADAPRQLGDSQMRHGGEASSRDNGQVIFPSNPDYIFPAGDGSASGEASVALPGESREGGGATGQWVVSVHEPPSFASELADVLGEWNEAQDRIEFRGLGLPQHVGAELLAPGSLSVRDATLLAHRMRAAAGLETRDAVVLFTEKRLFQGPYHRLFVGGTDRDEDPPSTAVVSLEFPRYLQAAESRPGRPVLFPIVLHNLVSIVAAGAGLDPHVDTRGCLLDFCGNMTDIVVAVERGPGFCRRCRRIIDALDAGFLHKMASVVARKSDPAMLTRVEQRFYGRTPSQEARPHTKVMRATSTPSRESTDVALGAKSMQDLPRDLLELLAEEYPDAPTARALWRRAGGRNRDVENSPRPFDLWQNLWLRSVRGAAVRPEALLRAVLEDLPRSQVAIRHLRILAPVEDLDAAMRIVAQVEAHAGVLSKDEAVSLLEQWQVSDKEAAFAAMCPALEGRVDVSKRSALRSTLDSLLAEIQSGIATGLVKASTSAAVKTFLAALMAT